MSELKGMRKLNKTIKKQLEPFGIEKAKLSTEYSYVFSKNMITYKLTESIEDEYFNEFVFERFGYKVENNFIFSLLHEVGHHVANDEIEGMIYNFCQEEKERIETDIQFTEDETEIKALEYQYFNLPDEIMATQWAVKYAVNHPFELQVMWACIKESLCNFYAKNGLTE